MHTVQSQVDTLGAERTRLLLQRYAWWPSLRRDVDEFCKGCLRCQQAKAVKPDRSGRTQPWIREIWEPWTDIHIDYYGPLNRTPSPGNFRHILTCVCSSSRSPRFIPTRSDTAKEAARVLLELFCQESFPVKITSDRGSAFVSSIIKTMSNILGIRLATSVANRAKANGLAERPHRFLRSSLAILSNSEKNDWHELCPLISLTYRSCVHPALGETPFFLERGRDPRLPQELSIPPIPGKKKTTTEFRRTLLLRLNKARRLDRELDARTKARQAKWYNRNRAVARAFKPGDLVWIWREPPASLNLDATRRTRKLEYKTSGAWRVLEQLSNTTYRLQHARSGTVDTFNVDTMCPVQVTDFTNIQDLITMTTNEDDAQAEAQEDDIEYDDSCDSGEDIEGEDAFSDIQAQQDFKEQGECDNGGRTLRPTPARKNARAPAIRAAAHKR